MPVDEIHIHEDDWGMRSLFPASAWADASADLEAAAKSGRENAVEGGMGWTALHVIDPPKTDFTSVGLHLVDASARLADVMPRVRSFVATASAGFDRSNRDPWGTYDSDAFCYGFDPTCFIKLEPKDDLVRAIWFEAGTPNGAHRDALRGAIEAIDELADAMIADYWANACGRVRDREFMDVYFGWLDRTAAGD